MRDGAAREGHFAGPWASSPAQPGSPAWSSWGAGAGAGAEGQAGLLLAPHAGALTAGRSPPKWMALGRSADRGDKCAGVLRWTNAGPGGGLRFPGAGGSGAPVNYCTLPL